MAKGRSPSDPPNPAASRDLGASSRDEDDAGGTRPAAGKAEPALEAEGGARAKSPGDGPLEKTKAPERDASSPRVIALDVLPYQALVVDVRGLRVLSANRAAERLLGSWVSQKPSLPAVLPEVGRGRLLELASGGRMEVSVLDTRGRRRTADLTVSPLDADGQLLLTLADTTEHVRTEASLRRAFLTQKTLSDLLRSTLDDRPLATQLKDALVLITGLPWSPFGPRAALLVVGERGMEPVAMLGGALPLAAAERLLLAPCSCGEELIDASGVRDVLRLFALEPRRPPPMVAVPLETDGVVVGRLIVQCAAADDLDPFEMELIRVVAAHLAHVIVHVRAREAAREQAKSLELIVERAVNAIIGCDARGRITTFNPAAEEMFGWSAAEIIGCNVERLVPPSRAARHRERVIRYSGGGQEPHVIGLPREVEALRKDGSRFPILIELSETPRNGELTFTAFIRDETERQRIRDELVAAREAALEASETKSRFLANMSHEIRTPMNGVIGMTDLLLSTPLDPTQRDAVETIRTSGEALLTVINDVLDFSRIEAGRLAVDRAPFPLGRTLDEVLRLLRPKAEDKGVLLRTEISPHLPPWVCGDAGRLRQILINLIGNAVKFTERGHILLKAEPASRPAELRFSVEDTGMGMTEEVLGRLFQPFVQADGSITRRFGGTGLGLTISRQLAELMDGRLTARSTPGEGSVFTLELPLPAAAAEVEETMSTADLQEVDLEQLRVLLVEDNPVNQKVATKMLERVGLAVEVAEDGRQGVDKVVSGTFDLVLMDCQMPVLDGYEATRELRRRGYDIPIIALTASAMKGDEERCREAGMDAFLSKPVRQRDIEQTLARIVAQRRSLGSSPADE